MDLTFGVVVLLALGFGALWFLKLRARKASEKQARADKREKLDKADARALQRSLDGRR